MSENNNFIYSTAILRNLLTISLEAISKLWNDTKGTFWRSTEHKDRDKGTTEQEFFPTVSFCCVEALSEFKTAFPDMSIDIKVKSVILSSKNIILNKDINTISSSITDDNNLNPFTIAIYIQCLVAINNLYSDLKEQILGKIKHATQKLIENDGVRKNVLNHQSNRHPFIVFHVFQAIYNAKNLLKEDYAFCESLHKIFDDILDFVKFTSKELMNQYVLHPISSSDAIALIFCAANLSLSESFTDHQLILPALRACFEKQDSSGCWPLGRVIKKNKDQEESKVEISTYEVAETVCNIINWCSDYRRKDYLNLSIEETRIFLEKLIKTVDFAKGTIVSLPRENPKISGWCTDHPYGSEMIESWTTANVLQFAISLNNLIERFNNFTTLSKFNSVLYPQDDNWPKWQIWEKYRIDFEPDTECPILDYINENIVKIIKVSPYQLPSIEKSSVSILLFGPPGTAKTSIAKAVAEGLGWPIVSLSPGDFIEKGLEYIETQASKVFSLLRQLYQVVVLFDECDELFRKRSPLAESEQTRGIAAFVTASMLPKIQDLHDRGRVLFFICTNQFRSIDEAIIRSGRLDHVIAVGPPCEEARLKIFKNFIKKDNYCFNESAIKLLAHKSDLFTIPEIKHLIKIVANDLKEKNAVKEESVIIPAIENMKNSLTIGRPDFKKDYDFFIDDKNNYSYPHMERGRKK